MNTITLHHFDVSPADYIRFLSIWPQDRHTAIHQIKHALARVTFNNRWICNCGKRGPSAPTNSLALLGHDIHQSLALVLNP